MTPRAATLTLCLSLLTSSAPPLAADEPVRLLVKSRSGKAAARLDEVLARSSLYSARVRWTSRFTSWKVVELEQGTDVARASRWLASDPSVAAVEVEGMARIGAVVPDDMSAAQWFLDNTGQAVNGAGGANDADIDAPEAWDLTQGSRDIVVAILDTGVSAQHPDLQANVREAFGTGGSGFGDDTGMGHGTPVAGIIGAVGDNGLGMAGINWRVSLLSAKVCDRRGRCPYGAILEGLDRAMAAGARVVNMSFTCDEHQDPATGECGAFRPGACRSAALREALEAAGDAGILVTTAAGNCGANVEERASALPCAYDLDNVLCVAATDARDELAAFSNHGARHVRLAAPGTEIVSLGARDAGLFLWNGTSFASPMAGGVAALLLSRQSGFTPQAIVERLTAGDRLASLDGLVKGAVRLNAMEAVSDLFVSPRRIPAAGPAAGGLVGDFDGDGVAELCEVSSRGYLVSHPDAAAPEPRFWSREGGTSAAVVGDFDGDGLDDIARGSRSGIQVMRSTGDGFEAPRRWVNAAWKHWTLAGDVNGDGRDDLVRYRGDRIFSVSLSTGTSFSSSARWARISPGTAQTLADLDGDGRKDLVTVGSGLLTMLRSTGSSFSPMATQPAPLAWRLIAGDVDADGRDDLARLDADGCWRVSVFADGTLQPARPWACLPQKALWGGGLADTDGDGRADLVGLSTSGSRDWQLLNSRR
ncbi:MAG: S8 family serine peptidase [Candidatus Polarisedimenticolia bacterium]